MVTMTEIISEQPNQQDQLRSAGLAEMKNQSRNSRALIEEIKRERKRRELERQEHTILGPEYISRLTDWLGRARSLGVPLLTGLINIALLACLLLLLQLHGWGLAGSNGLAIIAVIVLAAMLFAMIREFKGAAPGGHATLPIGRSVNDNVPAEPTQVPAGQELAAALRASRSAFLGVAFLSGLINVLMLTGPLFMLQVYDRVLPSHSIPTLVGLGILTAALFLFMGILDAIRGRVLLRIGGALDDELSGRTYDAVARLPLKTRGGGDGLQPIRDLDQIRSFLGSPGPSALFDLPWMPLYVALCFFFHPLIGMTATFGALLLIVLTITTEVVTRAPAQAAVRFASTRNALLEASRRNAEVIRAMGMGRAMAARFRAINDKYYRQSSRRL